MVDIDPQYTWAPSKLFFRSLLAEVLVSIRLVYDDIEINAGLCAKSHPFKSYKLLSFSFFLGVHAPFRCPEFVVPRE